MTVLPQPTSDLYLLATLVDGMKTAMLTTVRRDTVLHSRPMAPVQFDKDGVMWFFVDARTERSEAAGPANVAFTHEGRAIYVSMAGMLERVDDAERVRALWTPFARPWFADGPASPHITLLRFVPESAEYWDAPGNRVVRLVALSAPGAAVADVEGETSALPAGDAWPLPVSRRRAAGVGLGA